MSYLCLTKTATTGWFHRNRPISSDAKSLSRCLNHVNQPKMRCGGKTNCQLPVQQSEKAERNAYSGILHYHGCAMPKQTTPVYKTFCLTRMGLQTTNDPSVQEHSKMVKENIHTASSNTACQCPGLTVLDLTLLSEDFQQLYAITNAKIRTQTGDLRIFYSLTSTGPTVKIIMHKV